MYQLNYNVYITTSIPRDYLAYYLRCQPKNPLTLNLIFHVHCLKTITFNFQWTSTFRQKYPISVIYYFNKDKSKLKIRFSVLMKVLKNNVSFDEDELKLWKLLLDCSSDLCWLYLQSIETVLSLLLIVCYTWKSKTYHEYGRDHDK